MRTSDVAPSMIRKRLPSAAVATFWHIPWPNPESFGICPWRREILQGMLGSTILGVWVLVLGMHVRREYFVAVEITRQKQVPIALHLSAQRLDVIPHLLDGAVHQLGRLRLHRGSRELAGGDRQASARPG